MYQAVLLMALSGSANMPAQSYGYGMSNYQHHTASMENGKLVLTGYFVNIHYIPESRTVRDKDKDGKPFDRPETFMTKKADVRQNKMTYDLAKVKALDVNGKPVSLVGRFTQPTPVLTSFDDQAFDASLRGILKKDVVLLILPGHGGPSGEVIPVPPGQEEGASPKPPPPAEKPKNAPKPPVNESPVSLQPQPVPIMPGKQGPLPKDAPMTSAPQTATAVLDNRGNICLQQSSGRTETVGVVTKSQQADGKWVEKKVEIRMTDFSMMEKSLPVSAVEAQLGGQSLTTAALIQRLRPPRTVLITPNEGGKIDPYYMQVFRDDVLIITLPHVPPQFGHHGEVAIPIEH